MITPFQTIDDGATLQGILAAIVLHIVVGRHPAHLHRQADFHPVSPHPPAIDDHVSVDRFTGYLPAIDLDGERAAAVGKMIEVCPHGARPRPARNAETESETPASLRVYGDGDVAVPGITGLLREHYTVHVGRALDIQIDVDITPPHGILILRHTGHEARHVARTAGAAKPVLPLVLPHALQRVVVEKLVARQTDTAQHPIVECALINIDILALTRGQKHTIVPKHIGYRGTRLLIGCHVVEFIVGTKSFALCPAPHASGDEELFAGHVVPKTFERMKVGRVACQGRYIGHATVEIARAHGVAHNLLLAEDGLMVLTVFAQPVAVGAATGLLDKVAGHVEIAARARHLI